jgi:Lrp/AsnC family transcriptional regulator, leucine-responsive regulatory protein
VRHTPKLDLVDRTILDRLQKDGRISNIDLAEAVHLAPSTCLRRVRRLEDEGVIAGYVALLEPKALGFGITVFVEIALVGQRDDLLAEFELAVTQIPEVLSCHLMAGVNDYLLRVAARNVEDYERIHTGQLARLPHVLHLRSNITLRTVRSSSALPVVEPGTPPLQRGP